MNVKKIHWIGVGLSSPPGILYLVKQGYNLEVWNRTTEKASRLLNHKINILYQIEVFYHHNFFQ